MSKHFERQLRRTVVQLPQRHTIENWELAVIQIFKMDILLSSIQYGHGQNLGYISKRLITKPNLPIFDAIAQECWMRYRSGNKIDQRIVEMSFENHKFEKGI